MKCPKDNCKGKLSVLYSKANGELVYRCSHCGTWWKIKDIEPWYDPDRESRNRITLAGDEMKHE